MINCFAWNNLSPDPESDINIADCAIYHAKMQIGNIPKGKESCEKISRTICTNTYLNHRFEHLFSFLLLLSNQTRKTVFENEPNHYW